MIGVIANSGDHGTVREFFELFKTPWEFYRSDRRYQVLLCAGDAKFSRTAAELVIIYACSKTLFDPEEEIASQRRSTILSYKKGRIPIYEGSITFRHKGLEILKDEISHGSAGYLQKSNGSVLARMGYDLFREVRTRDPACSRWVSIYCLPNPRCGSSLDPPPQVGPHDVRVFVSRRPRFIN